MSSSKAILRLVKGPLSEQDQQVITDGFQRHSAERAAPPFHKERLNWLAYEENRLIAAVTGDSLWDWLYIDELWVSESHRGTGLGRELMEEAERYASAEGLTGIWLWTQSWQAEAFYKKLGFEEFTSFPDFPKGHRRIGFRKLLARPS